MKLRSILSSLIATSLLLASIHPVEAQKKRPTGVASLAEMSCRNVSGGGYYGINEDVSVGLEIFRAVAKIDGLGMDKLSQNVCRLAQAKEKPKYKTLALAFGFNDEHTPTKLGSVVRLSIYKDGQAYGYKTYQEEKKYFG